MANSLGYKIFKTDCLEDMPFEQFKVLVHATAKMNKAVENATSEAIQNSGNSSVKKSTTFRIAEE